MKIVLSSYWRKNNLAMCFLMMCAIVLSVQLQSVSNPNEDKGIILVTCIYIGIPLILMIRAFRMMTYVKVNKDGIESYLFRKRLCKVDYYNPIYYAVFTAVESKYTSNKYIAISNKKFEYRDVSPLRLLPGKEKPFLASYDVKNQIVMPYDEKTNSLLQTKAWHELNSYEAGAMEM